MMTEERQKNVRSVERISAAFDRHVIMGAVQPWAGGLPLTDCAGGGACYWGLKAGK